MTEISAAPYLAAAKNAGMPSTIGEEPRTSSNAVRPLVLWRWRCNGGALANPAETACAGTPAVLIALTRGGLAAATRSLAIEYASCGIRVNAISPGVIQTPMCLGGGPDGLDGWLPPLGAGQVSDVVDGVLFLEAAPYITGEVLHIDGGQIAGHNEPLA